MDKNPRFFCDNCDCEVDNTAKACPNCGRFFTTVRCPSCGFSGDEKTFKDGCPSCGYSAVPGRREKKVPAKKKPVKNLPVWMTIICVIVSLILIWILGYCITR